MTQQAPLEERNYARAVLDMLRHVGDCDGCKEAACSRCGAKGFEHPDADACLAAAKARKKKELAEATRIAEAPGVPILAPAAPEERDLTDPTTKLRAAAHEARRATAAERLIAYWGLESKDVPEEDRWDCLRGAEWVRSDPGKARAMLEQIQSRKGCLLEDVDEEAQAIRSAFLKGFRSVCPGPGRPPTEEEIAARRAAVERIVALVSERFVNRHRGVLPHPAAVEAFRRGHDLAVAATDIVELADGLERVRFRKSALWGQPAPRGQEAPTGVAGQVEELRLLARWAAERLVEMKREEG